ncbi:MAG: DUF6179 domain-containing protein [Bacillota bacterium]|nr:DUF6179 domain-containing protein [Bacillota bacterium]
MDKSIINKGFAFEKLLSKEYYFLSLIQALHSNNLLSLSQIEKIQLEILDKLTETIGYFTRDDSSSVRVEVAEQIMLSIHYTIGIFLKSQSTIMESIDLIKTKDIKYLFGEGEKILRAKVEECKSLLERVMENRLQTENIAYIDTVGYGLELFFKEYDLRFASHETPCSIDYPLAMDGFALVGIEYLEDYLNKIYLENKFCSYFEAAEIEALLRGFNKDADHMLINIFQLVLVNCLGKLIIGGEVKSLDITNKDRMVIKSLLESLTQQELESLICIAAEKLCQLLVIGDKALIEYINKIVPYITLEIKRNLITNTLENVFITLSRADKNVLKYEDGKSIDNSKFKWITEEIRTCSSVEDKIRIIREEIHSLKDLEDVLGADCIFNDEFVDIFKTLEDFEIALLIKSIYNNEAWNTDYGTESEKKWHEKLKNYLDDLEKTKKEDIIRLSQGIDI